MAKKGNRNGNKAKKPTPKRKTMSKMRQRPSAVQAIAKTASPFGPLSTINTAPVAIGNSLRGFTSQVVHTSTGCRVVGRDFGFTIASTGTVTGWILAGGLPITPACLPTTILRNFVNMYNKFKIRGLMVHYITSSPTSQAGDVLFYFQKQANSPGINCSSTTFLPYVLSDSNTIIGPQWTNHSVKLDITQNWLETEYGVQQDLNAQCAGDIFVYSKTAAANSPGYIVLDYDIEFKELSMIPRLTVIPTIEATWQPIAWNFTAVVGTANVTNVTSANQSTTWAGGVTIPAPTVTAGSIYKLIWDDTNSTYTTGANTTQFSWLTASQALASAGDQGISAVIGISPADGYTLYAVCITSNGSNWGFHATYEAAVAGTNALVFQSVRTYNMKMVAYIKLVGYQVGVKAQYSVT